MRELIAAELERARIRSLELLEPLSDDLQVKQHSPLMSPLVWDLAHVGNYEDQWLLRKVAKAAGVGPEYDDMYNAFRHPRRDRPRLALLGPAETRAYISEVRRRVIESLEDVDLEEGGPLHDSGYIYGMVIQHEQQHAETMLATLQLAALELMADGYPPASLDHSPVGAPVPEREVLVDPGAVVIGTETEIWAYDNERPAFETEVAPFWMDTGPVTNRAFVEFIDDSGYSNPSHWSPAGWVHRRAEGLEHPQFWIAEGNGWLRNRFGHIEGLRLDEPVMHVCWYEAEAWCNWAGRRLPTEVEWEAAASSRPDGTKTKFPWGDQKPDGEANLGQVHFGPSEIGAYPGGAGPWGCHQMIGDVWEWTSSAFGPYPEFHAFPYDEYSKVFFGDEYRVLRGGSWATDPVAVRNTFRNWDYPIRRQIFSGFRSARDV